MLKHKGWVRVKETLKVSSVMLTWTPLQICGSALGHRLVVFTFSGLLACVSCSDSAGTMWIVHGKLEYEHEAVFARSRLKAPVLKVGAFVRKSSVLRDSIVIEMGSLHGSLNCEGGMAVLPSPLDLLLFYAACTCSCCRKHLEYLFHNGLALLIHGMKQHLQHLHAYTAKVRKRWN